MRQMVVDMGSIKLPVDLQVKIGTEQVLIRETDEGFLLVPLHKQAGKARGILKGSGFSRSAFSSKSGRIRRWKRDVSLYLGRLRPYCLP